MGTTVPSVGTLVNRGGYNPEVRVRGGRAAHTWRVGNGTRQGRRGGRTRQTGAPLRVGKGHHVVPALHIQISFLLCSCARTLAFCLCLCFCPATRPRNSLLSSFASALYSQLVLLSLLVLASAFVIALHLHFSLTFRYSCSEW